MPPSQETTTPTSLTALGSNRLAAPLILEDDLKDRIRTLTITPDYETVIETLRGTSRYLHEVGHRVETDLTLDPPGAGPVTLSIWPTRTPTAHPDRDFEDYFSGSDGTIQRQSPTYTSIIAYPFDESTWNRVQAALEYVIQVFQHGPIITDHIEAQAVRRRGATNQP